jgi:hypothetical protein
VLLEDVCLTPDDFNVGDSVDGFAFLFFLVDLTTQDFGWYILDVIKGSE